MVDSTTPKTPEEFRLQGWRRLSKEEVANLAERFHTLAEAPDCNLASNDGKQWQVDVYVCQCVDREVSCWVKE